MFTFSKIANRSKFVAKAKNAGLEIPLVEPKRIAWSLVFIKPVESSKYPWLDCWDTAKSVSQNFTRKDTANQTANYIWNHHTTDLKKQNCSFCKERRNRLVKLYPTVHYHVKFDKFVAEPSLYVFNETIFKWKQSLARHRATRYWLDATWMPCRYQCFSSRFPSTSSVRSCFAQPLNFLL